MELHFPIGQCPAGTRLLSTPDSLSGSGSLLVKQADPATTLAVDMFPFCIDEPSRAPPGSN